MKSFKIPVVYQMWGICAVEAKTITEAKKKIFTPGVGLPTNASYIDDSMEIDVEGITLHNPQVVESKKLKTINKRKLSFLGVLNIKNAVEELSRAEIVLKMSVWDGKDKSLSMAIAVLELKREELQRKIKNKI